VGKNMLIGQSGGPTAVINSSLAGAVRKAMVYREIGNIYGAFHGIEGVLNRKIIDLRTSLKNDRDFSLLQATPAMALGSCRFKLSNQQDENYKKILEVFHEFKSDIFFISVEMIRWTLLESCLTIFQKSTRISDASVSLKRLIMISSARIILHVLVPQLNT